MEHGTPWILNSLIYLGAAVLAVPLARLLGLGSIIGYLAAGIAIGPWGLKLVTDAQAMLHFAEFGVVLMLFLVGLELEPKRLWSLRRPIFGWGSAQFVGSAALLMGAGVVLGVDWRLALVAGLGLALSSTAIGLGVLAERNLMATTAGQNVLSVALLQDMAAIPVLAILPLLAVAGAAEGGGGWWGAAKALGVIAAIILGGRLLLRPALRWIARSDTPEIFTAASLLLVVATAALMESVGLSMALGAFLAGVLLAESEYRRELETDLEPFKGLLLGLFFIAVGMSIDFAVVLNSPLLIAAVVFGFLLLKALVLVAMARAMPVPLAEAPVFVILLAQGGEFGFVVFQTALGAGVISPQASSFLVAAVAISMLLTPLLLVLVDRLLAPRLAARAQGQALDEIAQDQHAPIIICGFGRYGQIVGLVQAHFAQATLVARARDVTHWYGLHSRGVQHIERETLDSALLSGRSVLELMGWERHAARNQALRFRQHTIDLMVQMAPHQGDEKKLISAAKQGRQELEPMGSKEREQRADSKARRGEGFSTRQPSSTGDDAG